MKVKIYKQSVYALIMLISVLQGSLYPLSFFTSSERPEVEVTGIDNTTAVANKLSGHLKATSNRNIKTVSFFIDNEHIFTREIDAPECGFTFNANIKRFGDGAHTLRVEVKDDTMKGNTTIKEFPFIVSDNPWFAGFESQKYQTGQGKTLHVSVKTNQKLKKAHVEFMGATHPLYRSRQNPSLYEGFIPVALDAPIGGRKISAVLLEHNGNTQKLESKVVIQNTHFKLATGKKFKTHKKHGRNYNKGSSRGLISTSFITQSPQYKLWDGQFQSPISIKGIGAPFGEHRTSKELGRYVHKGVDLVETPGAPIKAPANGIVVLKKRNKWTGNTVVIDHGCGVFSLYAHMSKFGKVGVGKQIKKNTVLGYIGKTGYAFGHHLHWEIRINGIPVDPMEWLEKTF